MYLIKYISLCGLCSRRKALDLIKNCEILVNGEIVQIPFELVSEGDVVTYQGVQLKPEEHLYLLLNKPKDYLTTCSDERGRKTVMELIENATSKRIYPVGRLDRGTTGLLLFTNDGLLAQKLSHPSNNVSKVYQVWLSRPLAQVDLLALRKGVDLEDGLIKVDSCLYSNKTKREVVVQIHSGKNRIVRRIFDYLGYEVEKLDRINYAGLTKKGIPLGKWRFLSREEVASLKLL